MERTGSDAVKYDVGGPSVSLPRRSSSLTAPRAPLGSGAAEPSEKVIGDDG